MSKEKPEPQERRPEDFDADFDALVSGLELDADFGTVLDDRHEADDGTDNARPNQWGPMVSPTTAPVPDLRQPAGPRDYVTDEEPEDEELTPEDYKPAPVRFGRPSAPAVAGWVCFGVSLAILFTAILGVALPTWLGYLAVACFVASMGILLWRLPNSRDPGDGDGAVL